MSFSLEGESATPSLPVGQPTGRFDAGVRVGGAQYPGAFAPHV
ncbi:MAG: hypothetical protein ABW250_20500 [Pyrinomonadaceae bacterium]